MRIDRRAVTLEKMRLSHARDALASIVDLAANGTDVGTLARIAQDGLAASSLEVMTSATGEPLQRGEDLAIGVSEDLDDESIRDAYDHARRV